MSYLEIGVVPVIVGALDRIKKGTNKRINKIPVHMAYKKLHLAEMLISLGDVNEKNVNEKKNIQKRQKIECR